MVTQVAAATSSGPQAFAAAQSRNPRAAGWYRRCQEFVRTALGLGPGAGSASEAYAQNKARGTIHLDRNPPPNVPVFWDTGNPDGHVALSAGGGQVWSNDIERHGQIDEVPLTEIEQKWGARYLGWGTYLNGTNLPVPGAAGTAGGASFQPAGLLPGPLGGLDDVGDYPGDIAGAAGKGVGKVAGATGNAIVDGLSAVAEPLWGRFGEFATKSGFVLLGLAMVGLGINRMSQSPSAAGQAVAGTKKVAQGTAKATTKVATAPVRKANAVKSNLRGATVGAATKSPPKTAPSSAAAAPSSAKAGPAPAPAPRPRPASADKPPF